MNENFETALPEVFDPETQEGTTSTCCCRSACITRKSSMPAWRNPSPATGTRSGSLGRSPRASTRDATSWQHITFMHSKAQAVTIGRRQLKDLCTAIGVNEQVTNVEVFKFVPCQIKIGIEKDKQGIYADKNRVSRVLPFEEPAGKPEPKTAPKPEPKATPATAQPAPAGNGTTPPWRKPPVSRHPPKTSKTRFPIEMPAS